MLDGNKLFSKKTIYNLHQFFLKSNSPHQNIEEVKTPKLKNILESK